MNRSPGVSRTTWTTTTIVVIAIGPHFLAVSGPSLYNSSFDKVWATVSGTKTDRKLSLFRPASFE